MGYRSRSRSKAVGLTAQWRSGWGEKEVGGSRGSPLIDKAETIPRYRATNMTTHKKSNLQIHSRKMYFIDIMDHLRLLRRFHRSYVFGSMAFTGFLVLSQKIYNQGKSTSNEATTTDTAYQITINSQATALNQIVSDKIAFISTKDTDNEVIYGDCHTAFLIRMTSRWRSAAPTCGALLKSSTFDLFLSSHTPLSLLHFSFLRSRTVIHTHSQRKFCCHSHQLFHHGPGQARPGCHVHQTGS